MQCTHHRTISNVSNLKISPSSNNVIALFSNSFIQSFVHYVRIASEHHIQQSTISFKSLSNHLPMDNGIFASHMHRLKQLRCFIILTEHISRWKNNCRLFLIVLQIITKKKFKYFHRNSLVFVKTAAI